MKHTLLKILTIFVPVLLLLVALQYSIFSVLSVRKQYQDICDSAENNIPQPNEEDSTWVQLYKEKTWLESRLNSAKSDSICLSINLKDSVIQLELKGVVLLSSPMITYSTDRLLKELTPGGYHNLFSKEVQAINDLSTIEKVPLIIKQAPKDTIEYARQSHAVDSLPNEEVHWLMQFENGIELHIEGSDSDLHKKIWRNKFWQKQNFATTLAKLKKTLRFETPEYHPRIMVVISKTDAKAIYRALPEKPLICIRM